VGSRVARVPQNQRSGGGGRGSRGCGADRDRLARDGPHGRVHTSEGLARLWGGEWGENGGGGGGGGWGDLGEPRVERRGGGVVFDGGGSTVFL